MSEVDTKGAQPTFRIIRRSDTPSLPLSEASAIPGLTPVIADGLQRMSDAGYNEGCETRQLISLPNMSLYYIWFKSGCSLPLHSHNTDCLYYIVAGSLKVGTEELGPGEGIFVGSGVPYTYKPGPDGVEVLEFRTTDTFDIQFQGKTKEYYDKMLADMMACTPNWSKETRPSGIAYS